MSREPGISPSALEPAWRTSSYSGGQGDCVEVADNLPTVIPVRDSKRPTGPALAFSPSAWTAFVDHLR
ncbi:DUF397 domain-containing protein [Streptomyces shenzhenensis]|uniref:DUF397 domain-containing protein n=1 Tax=Streptomyces shenzhenensis TaxID=943815 RepID=UPI0015F0EA8F|nr:DUF397 domain-containing protein [Streptomyces shenzhenensis]